MKYAVTATDRNPVPAAYAAEPRYLGYRDADQAKPYAHYFQKRSLPVQVHVRDALIVGPVAAEYGLRLSEVVDVMSRAGYRHLETGYTVNDDGHVVVAVLTAMPGVTGEMWDWWFGWHGTETARYKLWHPDAHYFSSVGEDRSADRFLTDRQRYTDNVSYVDEYLGHERSALSIRFFDPARFGFAPSRPGETTIVARGGPSAAPVSSAWLVHQVRATNDGVEMRSRFIVNDFTMLPLPAHSVTSRAGQAMTSAPLRAVAGRVLPTVAARKLSEFGPVMVQHCAQEMNHLASFLPQLYGEFHDQP